MSRYRLLPSFRSNWEAVVFWILHRFVLEPNTTFSRSQIMRQDNFDYALRLLGALGHNERSETPENTIQATIQKMRDHGHMLFLGDGRYQLTDKGFERMQLAEKERNDLMEQLKEAFSSDKA